MVYFLAAGQAKWKFRFTCYIPLRILIFPERCLTMMKLALPLLLLCSLATGSAGTPPKSCPAFTPSDDRAKWQWTDRACHLRTRTDLDHILKNHKLWLNKYAAYLQDQNALKAHGALGDSLRANLSGADLDYADLTDANVDYADLSGADLGGADLSGADLTGADLSGGVLTDAYLIGALLNSAQLAGADLTGANLSGELLGSNVDLTGAHLRFADLTNSHLAGTDLSGADLRGADLSGAVLNGADPLHGAQLPGAQLTGADLTDANLTGAQLGNADLTRAIFVDADLIRTTLQGTDFSDADLTRANLNYAVFEPRTQPFVDSLARAYNLDTLRWTETLSEQDCLKEVEGAGNDACKATLTRPATIADGWLLWLYWQRGSPQHSWQDIRRFLWNDALFVIRHKPQIRHASQAKTNDPNSTRTQGKYPLIDARQAFANADYVDDELLVNLAYQRHTQSWVGMIAYDWTCEYGNAPFRPLFIAVALALLAIPFYWLGFRQRLWGGQLIRTESEGGRVVETLVGDPLTLPGWRTPLDAERTPGRPRLQKLLARLRLERPLRRLLRLIASSWPRLRWEAGFLKEVFLFSLISVVNLGFEGLDFGRWVRSLFFSEYDLKARGWLRAVSGLQSLVGLGLFALSLLSFFGHRFE